MAIMKQMTLASAKGFEVHGRATRKAEFLAEVKTDGIHAYIGNDSDKKMQ
jgi:hypothetical protein